MKKLSPKKIERRRKRALAIIKALKALFPNPRIALEYGNPWELFVSVVLSAQCTDKQVNKVTESLFKKYRILDDYVKAGTSEFQKNIKSTGFYRNKAKNILDSAKILKQKFRGKIPPTMEEMLTLPGIGRKSANIILGNVYGVVEGIAVDTHVRRLSKKLGLTDNDTPEKIERDLMKIIPRKEWFSLTYRLIDYGRKYCVARTHNHLLCPLYKFSKK